MVTERFKNDIIILAFRQQNMTLQIYRMVQSSVDQVVALHKSPSAEPRSYGLASRVQTREEKMIVDAANGLYGPSGRAAIMMARIKYPNIIGQYFPECDVMQDMAPNLAEKRREEMVNKPQLTSSIHDGTSSNNIDESRKSRNEPQYIKTYGVRYPSNGDNSPVYNQADVFRQLRQGVNSAVPQNRFRTGYNPHITNNPTAQTAKSNNLNQYTNSPGTLDDRVRHIKLDMAT